MGGLVLAQDMGTAMCGLFNAGYFGHYWWRRAGSRGRRVAAAALVLMSAAALAEAAFSQALFWSARGALPAVEPSDGAWALARLPLFCATVLLSAIIVRRLVA